MDMIQVEDILMTTEEKDLEDTIREELDWLEIDEVENNSNKHLYPTLENDVSIDTFAMKDFRLLLNSKQNPLDNNIDIDIESIEQSTQDPQRFLAPK